MKHARKLPAQSAVAETARVEAGYTRDEIPAGEIQTARRSAVRVTLVARTCETCGRTDLDVRAPWGDEGALCASGVGCNTKARAIADLTVAGVTLEDIGRARLALSRVERAIRRRGRR